MALTRYRVAIPDPATHTVHVEATYEGVAPGPVALSMAAWTPGSYLVRDYARHVEGVEAFGADGQPLRVTKAEKATWIVQAPGATVRVRYRVWAHELTVRTSHVDATHAFLNGAPTFLWHGPLAAAPHEVELALPDGWQVVTALAPVGAAFCARDLDELIDSPIHAGPSEIHPFEAGGVPFRLVVWGRPDGRLVPPLDAKAEGAAPRAPIAALIEDTRKIVAAYVAILGPLPIPRYDVILMLAPGAYGGLEHRASTALLSSPYAFATRKGYEELLELVSHEFFHLWNVKRLRPKALGPFDYTRENYTRGLWVMEGWTSYYDRHVVRRAGLVSAKRYLESVAEDWAKMAAIPGRAKQSIEESSFDAWIKLYRPDENSVNSTVSYYLKGGLVVLALDLELRRRAQGKSLDDALRALVARYGEAPRGFEDDAVQAEVEKACGVEVGDVFTRAVRGREDPPLARELEACGLTLRPVADKDEDGPAPWLGVTTRGEGGRAIVKEAIEGGPGHVAGLAAGDELLALDGFKLGAGDLDARLKGRRVGDAVRLTLFRRDELTEATITLAARPPAKWEIVAVDTPDATQVARYAAWLGEPHPNASKAT